MHVHVYTCTCICQTVGTLAPLWKKAKAQSTIPKTVFNLPQQSAAGSTFKVKYDKVQKQLQRIAAMDDLLSGSQQLATSYMHVL